MPAGFVDELRSMLQKPEPCFLMQVHDGISTKVAQKAGFRGVWASSFGCSTALGLPDDDSMSPQEVLNYLRPILRASEVPVLVDGNCGFGSLDQSHVFLRSLVDLGAAGVCFEDKQYPKTNTFYSPSHPLRDKHGYCELIADMYRNCRRDELVLIARTEALVTGEEVDAVINRCEQYSKAGAEAIFVSWIAEDVTTLRLFIEAWSGRTPLLINPTTYLQSVPLLLTLKGVSVAVWANHNIRACVRAMSSICGTLLNLKTVNADFVATVNRNMSSMSDIFELIGYAKR